MRSVWIVLVSNIILLICSGISVAQNNTISRSFCLEEGIAGYYIPPGSVVHKFANGTTVVYGPNGEVIVKMNDSEAPVLPTPAGKMVSATHIFTVPSGSMICSKGNVTRVYKDGKLILTVVGSKIANATQVPATPYNGWLKDAENWSIPTLRYFDAYWNVPTPPHRPESNTLIYIFNAIEPNIGGKIIQPVLKWNYGLSIQPIIHGLFPNLYYLSVGTMVRMEACGLYTIACSSSEVKLETTN